MDTDIGGQIFEKTQDMNILLESQSILPSDIYQIQRGGSECYSEEICQRLSQV